MLVAQISGKCIAFQGHALNQLFGQLGFIQFQQLSDKLGLTLIITGLFDYFFLDFIRTEHIFQQVHDPESGNHFLQQALQLIVFPSCHGQIQDIAVEGTLCVFGCHVFHLRTRWVENDPFKVSSFGIYLYGRHPTKVIIEFREVDYTDSLARKSVPLVAAVTKGLVGRASAPAEENGTILLCCAFSRDLNFKGPVDFQGATGMYFENCMLFFHGPDLNLKNQFSCEFRHNRACCERSHICKRRS